MVLLLALTGCAGMPGGPSHQTDNACAFALFLPHPWGVVAMAGCTYGKDAVLGVDDEEKPAHRGGSAEKPKAERGLQPAKDDGGVAQRTSNPQDVGETRPALRNEPVEDEDEEE